MNRIRWCILGALSAGGLALLAAVLFPMYANGFSARERPTTVEAWIARRFRAAALPSDARARRNPVPETTEVLTEARAHWADHCATCHANDGSGDTPMGKSTYPPAPDMRLSTTQKMSDGELFYIIQNGVRLTAMPAWGGGDLDAQDSWKLVHFIHHLPQLTVAEKKEMETMNPKTPDEWKEQEEEARFLNGKDNNDQQAKHHRH